MPAPGGCFVRRGIVLLLLAGCAAGPDTRSTDAVFDEVDAAFQKKDYAAGLPALEELARRRDQWGAFVLGGLYLCARAVRFDCARAQSMLQVAEDPRAGDWDAYIARSSRYDLAWINAACEQPGFVRDADYALRLALELVRQWPNAYSSDTLAAAYANKGEFAKAISLQDEAIRDLEGQARSQPVSPPALEPFRARLRLYRDGKPARFHAPTPEYGCDRMFPE